MAFRVPAPDGAAAADGLPLMVLPPGTVANGYEMEYHASGGMSAVYAAHRRGRKYLVKEVEGTDSRRVLSLMQEKAFLERLAHPQIVRVYDLFEHDGFYCLVLDFIEGESLQDFISRRESGFVEEGTVISWALQLCDIFAYLHSRVPPIIYRDLKPNNVIVDADGLLHLVDFGIARVFKADRTQDTEPMGTVYFASPEHFGGAQTDPRSDIFTIGVTLHYLLTAGKGFGTSLFEYAPVREINPEVSPALEAVIARCLEVDPGKRFQCVEELRSALAEVREGEKAPPAGETVAVPAKSRSAAERYAAWAAILLSLVLVVWALIAIAGRPSSRTTAGAPAARISEATDGPALLPVEALSTAPAFEEPAPRPLRTPLAVNSPGAATKPPHEAATMPAGGRSSPARSTAAVSPSRAPASGAPPGAPTPSPSTPEPARTVIVEKTVMVGAPSSSSPASATAAPSTGASTSAPAARPRIAPTAVTAPSATPSKRHPMEQFTSLPPPPLPSHTTASPAPPPAAPAGINFSAPDGQYQVVIPAGFEPHPGEHPTFVKENPRRMLTVMTLPLPPGLSAEETLQGYLQNIRMNVPNVTALRMERLSFNGKDACKIGFAYSPHPGATFRREDILVPGSTGNLHVLAIESEAGDFARVYDDFTRMCRSFRLTR